MKIIYLLGLMAIVLTSSVKAQPPVQHVKIGEQIWMAHDLDVTTFSNGDEIFHAKTPKEWNDAFKKKIPAWCYCTDKTGQSTQYGKKYNWFAVNDIRGLAPSGYHIPSKEEWEEMINALGGRGYAGYKLKTTMGWGLVHNGSGNNAAGFNAVPNGFASDWGGCGDTGEFGYWWTSTYDPESWTGFAARIGSWDYMHKQASQSIVVAAHDYKQSYNVRCILSSPEYKEQELAEIKEELRVLEDEIDELITEAFQIIFRQDSLTDLNNARFKERQIFKASKTPDAELSAKDYTQNCHGIGISIFCDYYELKKAKHIGEYLMNSFGQKIISRYFIQITENTDQGAYITHFVNGKKTKGISYFKDDTAHILQHAVNTLDTYKQNNCYE
ncbi:MAG: fibrobacter succinogenes major paralogous domain-containing protein [Chitinophagales bacterium]|nr:fibrobacter succinogenes major paralogous domain-containing protein [Chitinophagales bacterium]